MARVAMVRRRRWTHWLLAGAVGVAGAYVLLIVGLNAAIRSHTIERVVNGSQPDVTMRIGTTEWTWWPNRIRGSDFTFLVHDPGVQMELHVSKFDVSLNLASAWRKTVHMTSVVASGIEMRLRATRKLPELCAASFGLPPISGQSDPPGFDTVPCLEQDDTARNPAPDPDPEGVVKVRMDRVVARDWRDTWIEHHRLRGPISLEGSWEFWPSVSTTVVLDLIDGRGLRLTTSGATEVEDLDLFGHLHVDDLQFRGDADPLGPISGTMAFDVEDALLDELQRTFFFATPRVPKGMPFLAGRGAVRAQVEAEGGTLNWFHARIRATDASLLLGKHEIRGELEAALRVDASLHPTRTYSRGSRLRFRDFSVQSSDGRTDYADSDLRIRFADASFFDADTVQVDLKTDVELSHMASVFALLPGGLPSEVAKLIIGGRQPARLRFRYVVADGVQRIEDIDLKSTHFNLDGRITVSPRFGGKLVAHSGPLHIGFDL